MKRAIPRWVLLLGLPAVSCVWILAIRIVWEQTVWTWERGAQMVGFSLMHSGLGAILVSAVMASLAWPVMVLVFAVWSRNAGDRRAWALLVAYALAWVLLLTPYGVWQRLFINKFSHEQAVELMTYAAALGDTRTVEAFIRRGIPVNAGGRDGTALHAAAVQAQIDTMQFLLDKGADVNALSPFGDSPMENARQAQERSAEAMALLTQHGGRLVRGTEEQRSKVIEQQVRDDIERMDMHPPR